MLAASQVFDDEGYFVTRGQEWTKSVFLAIHYSLCVLFHLADTGMIQLYKIQYNVSELAFWVDDVPINNDDWFSVVHYCLTITVKSACTSSVLSD